MKSLYTALLSLALCSPAIAQETEYRSVTIELLSCNSQAVMSNDAAKFGFEDVVNIGDGETTALLPTIKIYRRPDNSFMIHFLMADGTECHGVEGKNLFVLPFEVAPSEPT
jgi:hypothetical protein